MIWSPGENSGVQLIGIGSNSSAEEFVARSIKSLASIRNNEPIETIFQVSCRSDVSNVPKELRGGVPGADNDADVDHGYEGRFRLEYGAGAVTKVRYLDVREGTYQLPPVLFARAYLERWDDSSLETADEVQMACSFARGRYAFPSEGTVTLMAADVAVNGVVALDKNACPGVRYLAFWSEYAPAELAALQYVGQAYAVMSQSQTAPVIAPGWPRVDVGLFSSPNETQFGCYLVSSDGTPNIVVQAFVEF